MMPIEKMIETAQFAARRDLLRSTCGNISVRISETEFAISGSGSVLGCLRPQDIAIINTQDIKKFRGTQPSSETQFHQEIYLNRPEINAVLHFQSLGGTTLACAREWNFDLNIIPEVPVYVREVAIVPYYTPGSPELARAVGAAVTGNDSRVVILRNHGQIAFGEDLSRMIRTAEFFELAARIICQGIPLRTFTATEISDLASYR
jgi:ribulose-5-phosphate 4-epimerase/fuculose-1-phosphate aldolase